MMEIRECKLRCDLRELVLETHRINRAGKVHCPFHEDRHPSCHIYRDGFKCFACGAYGDHLDWLQHVHGLPMREAIASLRERAGGAPPAAPRRRRQRFDRRDVAVSARLEQRYRRWLQRTRRLPAALEGRGLGLDEALELGLAALGDDAVIPIRDARGRLLALKRRFGRPQGSGSRYAYLTAGHGAPPWLSPGFRGQAVLVVEGELNGILCHLALREAGLKVAVMAPAGASGKLSGGNLLAGRDVFVTADADEPGERARQAWRREALRQGARSATLLEPHQLDACELAAELGRDELGSWLLRAMFLRFNPPF